MNDQQTEQPWVALYRSALLELDYQKLVWRLQDAGKAIQQRLDAISGKPGHTEEQRSLGDAVQNLRVLQREVDDATPSAAAEQGMHEHVGPSGEYVVIVDANRHYVEASAGVCRLLGYTRDEILTLTIDDVTAPELREEVNEKFQQYVTQGGLDGEYMLLAKDGRRVPIRYHARVFPDGCLVAKWTPRSAA